MSDRGRAIVEILSDREAKHALLSSCKVSLSDSQPTWLFECPYVVGDVVRELPEEVITKLRRMIEIGKELDGIRDWMRNRDTFILKIN